MFGIKNNTIVSVPEPAPRSYRVDGPSRLENATGSGEPAASGASFHPSSTSSCLIANQDCRGVCKNSSFTTPQKGTALQRNRINLNFVSVKKRRASAASPLGRGCEFQAARVDFEAAPHESDDVDIEPNNVCFEALIDADSPSPAGSESDGGGANGCAKSSASIAAPIATGVGAKITALALSGALEKVRQPSVVNSVYFFSTRQSVSNFG